MTKILPSCSHLSTNVCLYHLDSNETFEAKDRWELHKDAVCTPEQILETAPDKTTVV